MSIKRAGWLGSTALSGGCYLGVLRLAVTLVLAVRPNAYALPTDGTVAAGSASIASTKSTVTVDQASQKAVINWQNFSIGQGEAVKFDQPNSTSVTLNRVLGGIRRAYWAACRPMARSSW